MKDFREQNYYELLEIQPDASVEQIQQAYEHAKRTFSDGALASYSLFNHEERRSLMEKIETAYRVLMNEPTRRRYDQELGIQRDGRPAGDTRDRLRTTPPARPLPETLSGRDLRQVRETLGISLEAVANQTRIRQTYLEFIEEDRYDKLPAEVYLKGYLALYARVIGLEADQVVNAYLRHRVRR